MLLPEHLLLPLRQFPFRRFKNSKTNFSLRCLDPSPLFGEEKRRKNFLKKKSILPQIMTKQHDSRCSKPGFLLVPHLSLLLTGVRRKMLLIPQRKLPSDIRCYLVNDYTPSVLYFSHQSTQKAFGSRCSPRSWHYKTLHGWQAQRSRVNPKRMDEMLPSLHAIHTSF